MKQGFMNSYEAAPVIFIRDVAFDRDEEVPAPPTLWINGNEGRDSVSPAEVAVDREHC
jgi:hypothetical protein